MQNYPGLSSDVPPVSALEEQILSYFRMANDMEEYSPFRDAAVTQSPAVETALTDAPASASGAYSFFSYMTLMSSCLLADRF